MTFVGPGLAINKSRPLSQNPHCQLEQRSGYQFQFADQDISSPDFANATIAGTILVPKREIDTIKVPKFSGLL